MLEQKHGRYANVPNINTVGIQKPTLRNPESFENRTFWVDFHSYGPNHSKSGHFIRFSNVKKECFVTILKVLHIRRKTARTVLIKDYANSLTNISFPL